jgi:chromosome transmission fidelity protein 1
LFKEYQHAINLKKQAILFSVMGGRLSEGINFSDELARALLIFGLPYSDPSAPEIAERMAYYDRKQLSITGK